MTSAVQTSFAYSDLAPDARAIVEAATDRLHVLERATSESIIEIGKELLTVKRVIPSGTFDSWIESEFSWSRRTAYNFIRVHNEFSGSAIIAHSSPTALIALASNTVSDDIRAEFVAKADAGEKVTHKDVKTRIATKDIEAVRQSMYKPVTPDRSSDDIETAEPLSDFPYEVVDPYTGEVIPHDAPAPRIVTQKATPARRQAESTEDLVARANATAANICWRHGAEHAIRIADAIYRQAGRKHD